MEHGASAEAFPFRKPDSLDPYTSNNSSIVGYETGVIVKTPKRNNREYSSIEEVSREIQRMKEEDRVLKEKVIQYQGSDDMLVMPERVVHEKNGSVTFSRVQPWLHEYHQISKDGLQILALPKRSLVDLSALFKANISLLMKQRLAVDLVGSPAQDMPKIVRAARHLLPVFTSNNLVSDGQRVKLVDVEGLINFKDLNFKSKFRVAVQALGSVASLGILETATLFKHE